jgi:hypothetical protein
LEKERSVYQFSRAMYRELAPELDLSARPDAPQLVLRSCECAVERLVRDRQYFARPARALYHDIRPLVTLSGRPRAWSVVRHYIAEAEVWLDSLPQNGLDARGEPLQCRATTRRGTPCQRMPLPANGYCPSHQHLVEVEGMEKDLAIAA